MSETLRQRLLAAVFDDEVIGDDLVRDLALSSEAHGELVRLAAVLAGLPGRGARDAEARLDSLLDHVALVAASMSALARGSDVMRSVAEPQPVRPAGPRAPTAPPVSAGQRAAATPGDPPMSPRIRVDRTSVRVGAAAAAAILVGILAWPGRDVDEAPSPPRGASRPVVALPVPRPPAAVAPPPAVAAEQAALVHVVIRVSPSAATITIDDVAVDGNPFSGRRARDGGSHRIGVSAPGYISKIVTVDFGANVTLDVSLERAPVVVAAVTSPAHPTARPRIAPPTPAAAAHSESPARRAVAVPLASPPPQRDERPGPPGVSEARVQLVITTNVPGSEIAIDDERVGTTPLREPLWVRPGRHTITVMHAGYLARTRVVELDANAGAIEIALTSSPPPEAAIEASPGDPPARSIDPVNPYGGSAPDR